MANDLFITDATNTVDARTTTIDTADPIEIAKLKFKREDGELDVQGLARGKIEADAFIERLKKEASDLRSELDTRLSYEEFLDEIKSSKVTTSTEPTSTVTNEPSEHVGIKREDVMSLVKETLNQERTQAQRDANRARVKQELEKAWGSSFGTKLSSKAEELNLSKEFITSIAETNPAALLKLVDAYVTTPNQPNLSPPEGTVRREQTGRTGQRNEAYYEDLRKKDKRHYWSVAVQAQMHKDAQALGESFFS